MNIKIGAHQVDVRLIKRFQETLDRTADHDYDEKLVKIQCMSDSGSQRPLSALFVDLLHEISHEVDDDTGHMLFTSADQEELERKERGLVAYSNGLAQVLLDNGMVSTAWLAKFQKEVVRSVGHRKQSEEE